MGYKDIRFLGFYIHEDAAYERALSIVNQEMAEREPKKDGSNTYQPDPKFKAGVQEFSREIQLLDQELRDRVKRGGEVSLTELKTLDRSERLYAQALGQSAARTPLRLAYLDAGLAVHGHGLSRTESLKRELGMEPSKASKPYNEVHFRL